jgi:hypothetical protein
MHPIRYFSTQALPLED